MVSTDAVLRSAIDRWLADPESDVEYAELVEGRWAVRMRQAVRDATTVYFDPGPRSLRAEAYVLPPPESGVESIHTYLLRRNESSWRCFFAIDRDGAIYLRGRLSADHVDHLELDHLLGEIYDSVETTFRTLLRLSAR